MDEKQKHDYFLSCGVLKKWHTKKFTDFVNDAVALKAVKNYLANYEQFKKEGLGIYFYGSNGTGKSHLLNCMFKYLIDQRQKVYIISFTDLITTFVGSWGDGEQRKILNLMREVEFLAIEEIGKEFKSKTSTLADTVFDNVIRYRIQMNKPTFITSNKGPTQIKQLYTEDIASMLREACIPLPVTGKDYRDEILDQNIDRL